MLKNDILSLIYEWQGVILRRMGVERSIESSILGVIDSRPIKIVTGFRRTGKSFLAQRIAQRLVSRGDYKIENILYLNFEDYRLTEINTAAKLAGVYDMFLSDVAKKGKRIILLDEVQNVVGWDKFVRTIYEKAEDVRFLLTGSNSELLSAELGTNLAGRFIEFFIYPFSFPEFLVYKGISLKDEGDYIKAKPEVEKLFSEHVNFGGLPEIFEIATEDAKLSYLKGIVTKVVLDDIVKRFGVDNVDVLEKLLNHILANVGGIASYTNLKNKIRSLGLQVKIETIIRYLSYFVKALAILEVDKFDWKQRKIFSSSRKYYAMDCGLPSLYRPIRENFPMRLENLALLHLKAGNRRVFYGADERGKEIDFIVDKGNGRFDKYQVCLDLGEHNRKRELGVFDLADKYLKKGDNILLTLGDVPQFDKTGAPHIKQVNMVKWFLDIE